MNIKQINEEVLYAQDRIVKVGRAEIEMLKERVLQNERHRIRLCAHDSPDSSGVHEMFVALTRESYVKPHKHVGKSESFHIIEGSADLAVFDDSGNVTEVIRLGDYLSGHRMYYRMSQPYFHTPLVTSEVLVFHEITDGPFSRSDTEFASWAPDDADGAAGREYVAQLQETIDNFMPLAAVDQAGREARRGLLSTESKGTGSREQ